MMRFRCKVTQKATWLFTKRLFFLQSCDATVCTNRVMVTGSDRVISRSKAAIRVLRDKNQSKCLQVSGNMLIFAPVNIERLCR